MEPDQEERGQQPYKAGGEPTSTKWYADIREHNAQLHVEGPSQGRPGVERVQGAAMKEKYCQEVESYNRREKDRARSG